MSELTTREKLVESAWRTRQQDGSHYYKGYTGANAISLYASEKYDLNCACSWKEESDILCEIFN